MGSKGEGCAAWGGRVCARNGREQDADGTLRPLLLAQALIHGRPFSSKLCLCFSLPLEKPLFEELQLEELLLEELLLEEP